jgi:hypothetical protein
LFDDRDSSVWDSYGCPPSSVLIFSQAVRHHRLAFPNEMPAALTPERQRFFNEVKPPRFDRW